MPVGTRSPRSLRPPLAVGTLAKGFPDSGTPGKGQKAPGEPPVHTYKRAGVGSGGRDGPVPPPRNRSAVSGSRAPLPAPTRCSRSPLEAEPARSCPQPGHRHDAVPGAGATAIPGPPPGTPGWETAHGGHGSARRCVPGVRRLRVPGKARCPPPLAGAASPLPGERSGSPAPGRASRARPWAAARGGRGAGPRHRVPGSAPPPLRAAAPLCPGPEVSLSGLGAEQRPGWSGNPVTSRHEGVVHTGFYTRTAAKSFASGARKCRLDGRVRPPLPRQLPRPGPVGFNPDLCRGGGCATALPERGYPRGTAASPTGRAGRCGRLGGERGRPGASRRAGPWGQRRPWRMALPPRGVTPAPAPRPACPSPAARALSPPAAPSLLPPSPALQPSLRRRLCLNFSGRSRWRRRAGEGPAPALAPSGIIQPPSRPEPPPYPATAWEGCGDPERRRPRAAPAPAGRAEEKFLCCFDLHCPVASLTGNSDGKQPGQCAPSPWT
ncbi:collagen alpha-1(I) chain-like [Strigops habroptila]|uniref:collagen alpha-1(I) chain-like n=1 Tax=Strigops habroptila TaxID=2489341 RepID=UPI0011CF834E|nr:collagen alpha-1(I) chain-like [Strigops habroptila]